MLPTFVISLREGVEAALIVGFIAAFLGRQGQSRHLRFVWLGVLLAASICLAAGVGLQLLDRQLPQRQQEGLETVVGVVAVTMVTYMIIWMRRNARNLKGDLELRAGEALARGSAMALVGMAFLAVMREGLETAVFFLAAFQSTSNAVAAGAGAVLGLAVAVAIGFALYRGGVRINLSRFFNITAVMLVLVAAGLLATSVHTAWEAGWLQAGRAEVADLSWLVAPGSVRSALLTGMFGLQPRPSVSEVSVWAVYLVPLLAFVLWPRRRASSSPRSNVEPTATTA